MAGSEKISSQQVIAGNDVIDSFARNENAVLLVAQPQQGKTGVAIYVIDRFVKNAQVNGTPFQVIYLINLSDNELKKQTRQRLRSAKLSEEVKLVHREELRNFKVKLSPKESVLVVMDECHYAIDKDRPVHNFLRSCGIDYGRNSSTWDNQNVSLLSISATPFAHYIKEAKDKGSFNIVGLPMNPYYYSLRHAMNDDRLVQSEPLVVKRSGTEFLSGILDRFLDDCETQGAGYFVIRQTGENIRTIRDFITNKYKKKVTVEGYSTDGNDECGIDELDDSLSVEPARPTVVLIRGTMRAGKTLKTTKYIRGWCESPKSKSDAKLQALRPLGYPSGHDAHSKFDDVFPIYCNMKEVQEEVFFYEEIFRDNDSCVVPSGIRNKPSVQQKHEYAQILFDFKPTIDDVRERCERMNMSFPEYKTRIAIKNNSKQNEYPLERSLVTNEGYHTRERQDLIVCHVDGPSRRFPKEWKMLLEKKSYFVGKYVAIVDTGRKKQRDLDTAITKSCCLNDPELVS